MSRAVAMLRDEARLYRQAVEEESMPEIKRRLASHACALAQLAEKIEREGLARKFCWTGEPPAELEAKCQTHALAAKLSPDPPTYC
jgi:hypothetical protein